MNGAGRFCGCLIWTITALIASLFVSLSHGQVRTDSDRYECQHYNKLLWADEDLLAFSDDESMVAFVLYRHILGSGGTADWRVVVLEVPTCRLIQTIPAKADAGILSIAFSPNNKDIAVLINDGRILVYDARTGEENRDQQIRYKTVTDKPSNPWYTSYIQFSQDGTEIFLLAGSSPKDISIITFPLSNWRDGWSETRYSDSGAYTHYYYWWSSRRVQSSPERKYMAVEYSPSSIPRSNAPHRYRELHVYDLEAEEQVCYTDEVYRLGSIDWSPDGQKIIASVEDKDYTAIKSIAIISLQPVGADRKCMVQADEWNDDDESLNVQLVDAQHILRIWKDRNRPWPVWHKVCDLISREEVEVFAVLDSLSGKNISFSEYAVSPKGTYFAGVRNGNNHNAGLVLFRWKNSTRVSVEDVPARTALEMYPNPTADYVRFTQAGRIALYEQVDSQRQVAVDHLPDGVYLYRLITHTEAYSGKLVKQ